jgi:hypothetical protein
MAARAKKKAKAKAKLGTPQDRLMENALYFLRSALKDLDKDRQRSVIDFYTAVELFLKGRLLGEHWSLIVTKDLDKEKFAKGDFVSVSFEEACTRLKGALGQGISDDAKRAFNAVRLHRNKMVHFFHEGDLGSDVSTIALEQLQAWCHLNRLVTGEWADAFSPHITLAMRSIERSLVHHRKYAMERFNQLQPSIVQAVKDGATFVRCPSCTTKAAHVSNVEPWLRSYDCRVCFNRWSEMDVDCPECQTEGSLTAYEAFECAEKGCAHVVPVDGLYDLLNDEHVTKDNMFDVLTPANCDECQGYHTICSHKDTYLCTNCLTTFEQLYACGWCGENGSDDRDDSEWAGCEHCDGKFGDLRDD